MAGLDDNGGWGARTGGGRRPWHATRGWDSSVSLIVGRGDLKAVVMRGGVNSGEAKMVCVSRLEQLHGGTLVDVDLLAPPDEVHVPL